MQNQTKQTNLEKWVKALADDKAADVKISELSIENESLKNKVKELEGRLDQLGVELKKNNDVIAAELKTKKGHWLVHNSKYTIEDVARMDLDEIVEKTKTIQMATERTFKGVKAAGMDSDRKDEGLTIGDISIVSAEAQKRGR